MKNIFERLAQVANDLDDQGFREEADKVDSIIVQAINERKFDIFAKGRIGVRAQVYQAMGDMDEPPVPSHVKAEATLMVRPVQNGQVLESKVLWSKNYVARNLQELKAQFANDVLTLKKQYQPASYDEQFEYYPVKKL